MLNERQVDEILYILDVEMDKVHQDGNKYRSRNDYDAQKSSFADGYEEGLQYAKELIEEMLYK